MNKTGVVFFLGAGFSKSMASTLPLGTKLLEEILANVDDETRTTLTSLLPEGFSTPMGTVGESLTAMQPFELLLSIVQRLRSHQLAGRPALAGIEANRLWRILVTEVAHITRFPHPGYHHYADPNTEFGQFIAFLHDVSRETAISIVTTNYDLIADKATQYVADECLGYSHEAGSPRDLRRFQYGFPIRGVWTRLANGECIIDQEYKPWAWAQVTPVYKLHGSTNWVYCDICKELDLSATRHDVKAVFSANVPLAKCSYCGSPYDWLLIPPVPYKSVGGHAVLERVWRAAEQALETARLVIFVGYSFPPADPVVLEMVATARFRSHQIYGEPWTYWVFDPDESVCRRYRSIFGGQDIEQPQYFKMELLRERWPSTC